VFSRSHKNTKRKKNEKAQFKNFIVKQCTEDLISPQMLARKYNINAQSIRQWVKDSGLELPTKYEVHSKFNMKKPSVNKSQPSTSDNQTSSFTNELILNLKSNRPSLLEASVTDNHVDLQTSPETVTSHDTFLCPKCDYKCQSQYHLDLHIKGHYDCSQCGMTFFGGQGARNLATHIKKHEIKAKKQFICQFCNVEYKTKANKNRHENTCKKKK
jgi:transposase-like protein